MTRSEPREQALVALYEAEQTGKAASVDGLGLRATAMVGGVVEKKAELDALIEETAHGWRIERMPPVDRTILRIAAYELMCVPETPAPVVISEAVSMAKEYSTEKSGSFVNGVLGEIAKRVRTADA